MISCLFKYPPLRYAHTPAIDANNTCTALIPETSWAVNATIPNIGGIYNKHWIFNN